MSKVIEILITLSISNWNQDCQASFKEAIYLTNMETDLEHQ